jgi:sporulation protein YlmC with PRC-barrel domain
METAAETSALIAADKVLGATIYNSSGDNLGSIQDIMIDQKSGNVAYAIMSSGGFLGIGSRHYPLPWLMLKYDTNLGGYIVDVDSAQLKGAPAYGRWY